MHNEATVMAGLAFQALSQRIEPDPAAVARLQSFMDRAVELRQGLADPARPMTLWELANSLLLRGKVSCLLGVRLREALQDLADAWRIARPLDGPSAESLRQELDEAMAAGEQAYPWVVANVKWPSRFRGPSA